MESPCPRCGTVKTESVLHGFIYNTCWSMGYHLRRCSYCNRKRLFKRKDPTRPHPDDLTMDQLQASFDRKIAAVSRTEGRNPKISREDVVFTPAQTPPQTNPPPDATTSGVALATDDVQDYKLCPKCGSTIYRRSRRRWYERWLSRPKMARCLKCGERFRFPR